IESNYKVPAKSESLPISFKINGGDVFHPSDNFEFGYYGSFNFGNKYSARHHDYRQYAITQAIEDNRAITVYDTSQLITRQESSYSTNMGINFSTGFKYNEWLKVDYQHLFTHISKDKVNYGWGKSGNIDDGIFVNQDYEEKSINSGTMHVGADLAGYGELQMTLNMSKSELYRPDSRSQVYKKAADQAEEFDDYNDNGIWDAEVSEEFVDSNNNGVWDQGLSETFNDINNNGEWDMGEPFTDVDGDGICGSTEWAFGFCDDTNGNGQWDGPETFIDLNGNGVWDASYDEELVDYNDNDEYDPVLAEGFVDENNNGVWDEVANLWEYRMMTSTQGEDAGKRSYNVGNETNESLSIDYEVPLSRFNFKTGLLLESKDRSFTKRELYTGYIFADGTGDPTSWPQHLLSNHVDSLGYVFENENWYVYDSAEDQETGGIVLLEQTASLSRNTYDASEGINAAYMMLDIPVNNVIQVIAGVRVEDYSLDLRPYNRISGETYYSNVLDTTVTADIDEMKYLPSFITNLTVNDRTKLRLAFSETLARPQFREVAPYDYEEFYGGEKAVGYPFLKTTSIQNYDIRYEFYPSAGEVISVAVFRKEFENPIDVAAIMQQENFYKVYQNAKTAKSSGIELEARLKIPYLKRFPDAYGYLVFNGTYTDSKVETHDEFYLFNGYSVANAAANLNRPLQGQSDLVMNASLNVGRYEDIDLTFSFNTFSKRLISVGGGVLNDEYEYPFHSLNAVISKTLDENWKLSFKATNLLNSEVKYGLEDRETGDVYYTKTYKPGMDASLALSFTI
ncbi:MAG: hypothetical protein H8D46_01470, partial [FCB group bacterium]|nr:hypothetical protein [FCB group bacterium]